MSQYDRIEHPQGINKTYVRLLCWYLFKRYHLRPIKLLLDIGAGTGDYYKTFNDLGLNAYPSFWDLEGHWTPQAEVYDYVFCKSVLEHISNTQHFLSETKRILNEGGLAIFLVPDWNSQWKSFYDDSTHIKPFTKKGLTQALTLAGFEDVKCEYFYQLPFSWGWLWWVPHMLWFFPYKYRMLCKLIRFSKERMLLGTGVK